MTMLLREVAWDGPPLGPSRELLSAHEPLPSAGKPGHKGWMRRLHLSHEDHREATGGVDEAGSSQREKDGADASPEIEPCRGKKHRFSLSRLFSHEDHAQHDEHDQAAEQRARGGSKRTRQRLTRKVAPLEIPPLLLMNERNGGVTVSGRRVPFTRDAHRRKQHKVLKVLPRIAEDRALGQSVSAASMEAYRRRAYYAGPKRKARDKK